MCIVKHAVDYSKLVASTQVRWVDSHVRWYCYYCDSCGWVSVPVILWNKFQGTLVNFSEFQCDFTSNVVYVSNTTFNQLSMLERLDWFRLDFTSLTCVNQRRYEQLIFG